MKIKNLYNSTCLLLGIMMATSCSTYYITKESLQSQLNSVNGNMVTKKYTFKEGAIDDNQQGKQFNNGLPDLVCVDRNLEKVLVSVSPNTELWFTYKSGAKKSVYFDTMFIKDSLVYGQPSRYLGQVNTGFNSVVKIEVKSPGATVMYLKDLKDIIILEDGRILEVTITSENDENVFFKIKHGDQEVNTSSKRNTIKEIRYANRTTPTWTRNHPDSTINRAALSEASRDKGLPFFRLALCGGWSYQTADVSKQVPLEFRSYIEDLKSGGHYGGDLTFYFSERYGAGIKYSVFNTSNAFDKTIYVMKPDSTFRYGLMSDKLSISFIAASFSRRFYSANRKNTFFINTALGYMGYRDKKVLVDNYTITGSTMGLSYDLGCDFKVSENLALGFQLSYLSGTLFKLNLNDGFTTKVIKLDKNSYEGLNRVDLSAGIRFIISDK